MLLETVALGEGPVVQSTGLYGKEKRESFVERADLLNRPLRTRMVGGVGAGSEKLPAPIRRHSWASSSALEKLRTPDRPLPSEGDRRMPQSTY